MKKIILALVFLFCTTPAFAEVFIDEDDVVQNVQPGYCMWVSLQTLGNHHGIDKLQNLLEIRKQARPSMVWNGFGWEEMPANVGTPDMVINQLQALGVKATIQRQNWDTAWIRYAIKKDLGCVVCMRLDAWPPKTFNEHGKSDCHAVILTEYKDKIVKFIDTNKPKEVLTKNREWFDTYWVGYVVVVEK